MGTDTNALECNESLSLIYIVYLQLIAIKKRKKVLLFGKTRQLLHSFPQPFHLCLGLVHLIKEDHPDMTL